MSRKMFIIFIIMAIMVMGLALGLDLYFQNQGKGVYDARGEAGMIFWLIGIVVLPITYIIYRLKIKKSMETEINEINDEDTNG